MGEAIRLFRGENRLLHGALLTLLLVAGMTADSLAGQRVQEIRPTGEIMLKSGEAVCLADVVMPSVLTGDEGMDERAIATLKIFLDGKDIQVVPSYGSAGRDRYGRISGDVVDPTGLSLRDHLLSAGLVMVYAGADRPAGEVAALLAREDLAREQERGVWRSSQVLDPAQVTASRQTMVLVEGIVRRAQETSSGGYLNFGDDWRTDVTVKVSPAATKALRRRDGGLEALNGKIVRVRGWVRPENGPMIDLDQPAHLELLPP